MPEKSQGAMVEGREYPRGPIRLLVPFPPGGSTDFTAGTIAGAMAEVLGQPVMVQHRPGEFGIAALAELARADAHTLLVGSVITNAITPIVHHRRMPFRVENVVAPISRLVEFPSVLITRTSVPVHTLQEFLEHAKRTWGRVRNGTDWIGSFTDLDAALLGRQAGVDVVQVVRAGGADALVGAVVSDEADIFFVNARTAIREVRAGRVKALAVTGPGRLASLPEVPTMEESGFPGVGTPHWHGLFAPRSAPQEVVRLLHRAVVRILRDDLVRSALEGAEARLVPSASPEAFAAELEAEMVRWRTLVAEINLTELD
ncbi:MAG: tripartite tricarboxylate transporter substrate-binding protein [Armatimonadota bacterium]|nr:tripartite tricarboxylate transporter substrate-binding protein [Armatimonadota bacterium]MDR7450643.1 tripartite tricarboxylate transporter substrate-binding protein [Armatimonadota bacterium]MDR7466224.1 tripartite tricarboxylate transporter substrate-binding protein [Armatimonadota bacterium]MDR7492945.1 tripartite tricarboxylate transporter substrate-binding protein [Armatimonadota bacterium]MDR7498298.1 tripartite tricarboxylate transporter substrate-binding protein [Armatimonadota bact